MFLSFDYLKMSIMMANWKAEIKDRDYRNKKPPNRIVMDNSVVCLSVARMEELQLLRSDTILLKENKRKNTLCILLSADDNEDFNIRMNKVSIYIYMKNYYLIYSLHSLLL